MISLSLFTPDLDLFDLNRVETLRGPQGTLFGSGSVGGTIRYITNQPKLGPMEGPVEANINTVDEGDIGGHLKGAINRAARRHRRRCASVGYYTHYAGFVDAVGPAGGKNVNDGSRDGGRASILLRADLERAASRRASSTSRSAANGFNREEVYNLFDNRSRRPAATFEDASNICCFARNSGQHLPRRPHCVSVDFGGVELTSVTSYINRDILVSRDAQRADAQCIGRSRAQRRWRSAELSCLQPARHHQPRDASRRSCGLASTGSGPFQWVVGGFYSKVNRFYAQRLPTPGSTIGGLPDVIAPGTPASRRPVNGFPANSPYNADLPYNIKQGACSARRATTSASSRSPVAVATTTSRKPAASSRVASSPTAIRMRQDQVERLHAARHRDLGADQQPPRQRPGLEGLPPRRRQRSAEPPALHARRTWRSSVRSSRTATTRIAVELRSRREISKRGFTFNAAALHRHQEPAGHGRCRMLLVAYRAQRAEGAHGRRRSGNRPLTRRRASSSRSPAASSARSSNSTVPEPLATRTGIRKGNRLPTVPKYQMAASATYGTRFSDNADWYATASYQFVGNRLTQPSDQEPGAGVFGSRSVVRSDRRHVRLGRQRLRFAEAAVLQPGQPVGGHRMGQRARARRLRSEPVRHEREAVARPRARRTCPRRLQHRHAADDRPDCPVQVPAGSAASPAAAGSASSATAASGNADLRGRIGDPGDGCVPGSAASASAAATGSGTRLINRE